MIKMESFKKALNSRTIIAIFALVILAISDELRTNLPEDLYVLIASVLGSLAIYFRIDAKEILNK